MVLHTLNALPDNRAYGECLRLLAAGDALLLMGDAVYAALATSDSCQQLQDCPARVHVLSEDAAARGITGYLWSGALLTDMAGFVSLTENYPRQQAWY